MKHRQITTNHLRVSQSPLGNNDKDESIVSSWDSSVKKPKRERSRVFDAADETSNEGNAIAAMNSYFKISDDEVDESTEFGDKSAEFSFSKDSNRKKLALSSSMGENSNGSRKDIINSKANVKDAVEDEEDDDDEDEDEDDEDQDVSDEENEDDNEEDDDDDDNDFSDSDTDDEEEKHGWKKWTTRARNTTGIGIPKRQFGSALMVTDHLVQNLAEKTAPERKKTTNM